MTGSPPPKHFPPRAPNIEAGARDYEGEFGGDNFGGGPDNDNGDGESDNGNDGDSVDVVE